VGSVARGPMPLVQLYMTAIDARAFAARTHPLTPSLDMEGE